MCDRVEDNASAGAINFGEEQLTELESLLEQTIVGLQDWRSAQSHAAEPDVSQTQEGAAA